MNQLEFQEDVLAEMRGCLRALEDNIELLAKTRNNISTALDHIGVQGMDMEALEAIDTALPEVIDLQVVAANIAEEAIILLRNVSNMRFWGKS